LRLDFIRNFDSHSIEYEQAMTIDRREFLRHLLSAAGLAISSFDRLAFAEWRIAAAQQPRRIIVVGAGLAGLVAAHELTKAGNDVVVLDAQQRAGGRVYTLRDPFVDGLYAEAGAARIPEDHDLTRGYAAQFGLKLVPFQPDQQNISTQELEREAGGAMGNAFWSDQTMVELLKNSGGESAPHRYDKIDGGNDRLPAAFASRLGDRIHYGARVVRIEQDKQGVRAVVQQDSGHEVVSADFLICAIPFTVLRNIDVSPAFSSPKRKAIEQLNYSAASRIYLQSASRYWVKSGKNGFERTLELELIDATFGQPGDRGIMMLYALGDPASRLEHQTPDQRIQYGRTEAERVLPGMTANFEKGFSWCWGEVPWARGAFAVYLPGQVAAFYAAGTQSEGRIYFAGEHLSSWPGWMQGALASGLRAAREVSGA
jgi:monoamine oxidase